MHKWDVYWSPEGRKLESGVEAESARAAVRKVARERGITALGEMYAQPSYWMEPTREALDEAERRWGGKA